MTLENRLAAIAGSVFAALAFAGSAWAHAHISPPVVVAKQDQVFTLAVPTEKEGVATTQVELTAPEGFSIDVFLPSPGWRREVQKSGSGEAAAVQKVTWSGGHVPTDEDAVFQFVAEADASKTYELTVRQTYSDRSVVNWSGPEDSDTPAPVIEAKGSLGGGGSSILDVVAIVLGALALAVAGAALLMGGGRRPLA